MRQPFTSCFDLADRAAAARLVFEFLDLSDDAPDAADLIIGFGHWDPRIPRRCCDLFDAGVAPRILFTGGRGAGTADLPGTEAAFFREEARRHAPGIPDSAFLLESQSTNTGENVRHAIDALAAARLPLGGEGLRRVILVATPYRQRRVWLTCRKLLPDVAFFNLPPPTRYEQDVALFGAKGQDLTGYLAGEVERLGKYADLGYVERSPVPVDVVEACRRLAGPDAS
jgi:uncharacterized SAM-binding protein YcdF (DUF218 family)